MKSFLFASLVLSSLLLWQCNRTTYTTDSLPENDYLIFGSGGGYAGALTTNYLFSNGQLFVQEGIAGDKLPLGKISTRKAKKLFEMYQDSLSVVQYDVPGNLYYFVEWVGSDTTHKLQWAKGQNEAPAEALRFYDELIQQLPKDE